MPWILWSSGGVSVLGITFVVLWIWLPRWAPEWVVRYSPWVDPMLRAMAGQVTRNFQLIELEEHFIARIEAWGSFAYPAYSAGMESPDPRHRMVSVMAYDYERPTRSPLPDDVRKKLCDLALTDDHLGVRMYAFFALRSEKSLRMSEVRAQGFTDRESDVRHAVVHGLDPRTSERDWQTLLSALSDPDGEVRYQAVVRTRDCDERRAIPRLMEMLHEEQGPRNFGVVLSALGHFKVTEAIPVLVRLLEGPRSYHAHDLLRTITTIDAAEGFRVRVKTLQGSNKGLRAFVAQELGESGDPRAIDPLIKQLQDPEPLVFGYVVIALCQLKADSAVDAILDLLEARGNELMSVGKEIATPVVSGYMMSVYRFEVVDQVATMPLTAEQRERLERLRED